jgi:hypothetical protein
MPLWKKSLPLILLSLIVTLSAYAQSPGPKPSRIPSPPDTETGADRTNASKGASAEPSPTSPPRALSINQPTFKATTTPTAGYTYNYYYNGAPTGCTFWLQLIANIAIAVFAGGQVYFLWRTRDETQRAATAAQANAEAAQKNTEFSKQIAAATEENANVARALAEASKRAADVAEKALGLTDRPLILFEGLQAPLLDEGLYSIGFSLKNFGKGPAWLIKESLKLTLLPELPTEPNYAGLLANRHLGREPLPAGASRSRRAVLDKVVLEKEDIRLWSNGDLLLAVYGFIEYEDLLKGIYQTGFCWVYRVPKMADLPILQLSSWEMNGGPETYRYYRYQEPS